MAGALGSSRPLHAHSLVGLWRAAHRPDPHDFIERKPTGRRDWVLASSNGNGVISVTVNAHHGFASTCFPGTLCQITRVVSNESRVDAASRDS